MPMLDAYIPEGALSPEAEDKLLALVLGPEVRVPAEEWLAARQRKRAAALIEMAGADVRG